MSNSDSFIDEVTEEVRRDRLFQTFRRYGWIGIALVLLIVGGAAFNEYRKSSSRAEAERLGDAMLDALKPDAVADRIAGLATVPVNGPASAVLALITAAQEHEAADPAAAIATLAGLAADPAVESLYRELARLKSVMIGAAAGLTTPADQIIALTPMTTPGAPFRLLALEQISLAHLAGGDTAAATEVLTAISEDAEAPGSLTDRASRLLLAMGQSAAPAE